VSQAGRIVRWFPERGYGFITPDDRSTDVFLHPGDLASGYPASDLREGIRVSFTLGRNERGPKASDVRLLVPGQLPESGQLPEKIVTSDFCDVMPEGEFRDEVRSIVNDATSVLLDGLIRLARKRNWLE
jgi:cold shock protein